MTNAQNNNPVRQCPICKKPADLNSETFPFCSARCRLVDLNHWMEGRYAVTRPLNPEDIDQGPTAEEQSPDD